MHQKTLTIIVNQQRVSGQYSYTADCLNVEILEPYNYFTGGSYVPYFAKKYRNFNVIGESSATKILEDLYLLSDYVEKNKEFLLLELKKLEVALEALSTDYLDYSEFLKRRKDLRVKLYSSDPIKYQRNLIKLTKTHKEWKGQVRSLFSEFFDSKFPEVVPVDTQESFLKLLGSVQINELFHRKN